ncbi:DUF4231 domain-containing protein [Micromonospora fulviviridis]|uniref:DUF4231 domain-containing protein n=1 Tax=Micromonospora fulviviridis TaxID=47860 RepID=UPI00379CBE8A
MRLRPRRAQSADATKHQLGSAADVVIDAQAFLRSVSAKAQRNKRRARLYSYLTAAATSTIPAIVGLADTPVWLKLTTLVIALVMIWASVSLELDRPHERWALYRRYQRLLELESTRFQHELAPYNDLDPDRRRRLLAERLCDIEETLHKDWELLMPDPGEIAHVTGRLRSTS